ncbi:hypothetical protein IJ21_11590 [Paenibacillus sp. 32O-W]|uniref:DUF4855 domain-containing protein n=1 Tax=Paenibacillus sp. 32O-W TaxID=1695218 RepID=UPI0007216E05|nr:DUF4855 domain-containing protein [Paenibacillus sp. 32O-W]ALS26563.1 hypothetical protein IJ21_11590 [Paenibacillus sp. 32O-W]
MKGQLAVTGKSLCLLMVALLMLSTGVPAMSPKAEAAYFPPDSPSGGELKDLVLIYSGYYNPANYGGEDISAWPREQFKPYTAFLDKQGNRLDTFFQEFLFLGLNSPYGHSFHRETDVAKAGVKQDWEWFLDRIFTSEMLQLNALNEETKQTAQELDRPNLKSKVVIMIPFANEIVTQFGDVDGDGVSENLTTLAGRNKVTRWYIDQVIQRFNENDYSHLELSGFYWLKEDMDTTKPDEVQLVKDTADYIHSRGSYIFCWIPWSRAYAATQWASFKFDFAILQPNHFMNRDNTTTPETIKNSAQKSSQAGMGVEIEFDGQIFRSDKYRERFYDYLNGGAEYGFMNGSILAYYQDARGIYELTRNQDAGYPIYEDLYRFVKGAYRGDTQVATTLNTLDSSPFASSPGAAASIATDQAVQGKASMKADFGYYANSLVTGEFGKDFFLKDWSRFDSFRIDVFNPAAEAGAVTIIIGDEDGKQHYRYASLYKNSWNTVRIRIADLAAGTGGAPEEPGTVPIDVSRIAYIKLVQRNNSHYLALPNTYYFDYMRLVQEDGIRLNDLEWLAFGGNNSVALSKVKDTVREQNTAIRIDYGAYNVSQAWLEAPAHFKIQDWSGQQSFKADIYNPNGAVMNIGLKFTDSSNQTYYKRVALQPGRWNTVQVPVADLASGANATAEEGTSTALNVHSLKRVDFYQRNNSHFLPMPNYLYIDNVRLGVQE